MVDEKDLDRDIIRKVERKVPELFNDFPVFDPSDTMDRFRRNLPDRFKSQKKHVYREIERGRVSRRDFLKILGVTAGVGVVASTGLYTRRHSRKVFTGYAQPSCSDYDVIQLDSGEESQKVLSDGESFQNKLIDQRASGACFSIKADADNWEISNIGFKGAGIDSRFGFLMRIRGNGVVGNIYANNKQPPNDSLGMMFTGRGHGGHVETRHTYIEGFGNNAAYFSGQCKKNGAGGTVEHRHCYHRDNTPSNYRPAGEGSLIKDCVSIVDDPNHERAYYPNGSGDKARPMWANHTPGIRIENMQYYTNPNDVNPGPYFELRHEDFSDRDRVEVTAVDCVGNLPRDHNLFESQKGNAELNVRNYQQGQPSVKVLNGGVPTSPEMAACGGREYPNPFNEDTSDFSNSGSSGDQPASDSFTLTIAGGSSSNPIQYSFEVSDSVSKQSSSGSDKIFGNKVVGSLKGGSNTYNVDGAITSFNAERGAELKVGGNSISRQEFLRRYLTC